MPLDRIAVDDAPLTPFAEVDLDRVRANIRRLREHLDAIGAPLRLHVKTAKSPRFARMVWDGEVGPITVSTLAEAEEFAADGFRDIVYAVGIAPAKLDRVTAIRATGVDLTVLVDTVEQAEAVAAAAERTGALVPALIEIDCDGHRGGIRADDPLLLVIAGTLGASLRGVLAHAGESYYCRTEEELVAAAENERAVTASAAAILRNAGHAIDIVSVGSTPTAHHLPSADGITEVRAGNFVFFDLVMAGIGVCRVEDLALSVVVTVIGHKPERGWIMTDGGWTALSRDRGTAAQAVDQLYGLVADERERIIPDLLMIDATQEHGVLALRPGSSGDLPDISVGTSLRVYPNHACATAGQFAALRVVDAAGLREMWGRVEGW